MLRRRHQQPAGIARDGAVGHGEGAAVVVTPPPLDAELPEMVLLSHGEGADVVVHAAAVSAELPEMVLLVTVRVPP